ncbi:unnamed protein product, partial [Discosporangium mesarthrocarpum]
VSLAGPTLFSEIIQTAMSRSDNCVSQTKQEYQVLLILTDGIINDMQETIDLLVAASKLPLSVIIVGVGSADFSDMNMLDGDDGVLRDSSGNRAARDIVQFVPLSRYEVQEGIHSSRLAVDTIAEIPGQLLSFFASRGIVPNPPRPAPPTPPPYQAMMGPEPPAQDDGYDSPPPPYEP